MVDIIVVGDDEHLFDPYVRIYVFKCKIALYANICMCACACVCVCVLVCVCVCVCLCVCVCVYVSPAPRLLITSDLMWCDICRPHMTG